MIDLVGLEKRFGDRVLFRNLCATFEAGRATVLSGPSGCGKTTLLRLIDGFERAEAGEIRIDGTRASTPEFLIPPHRRGINMVFQNLALWPHMTVRDHVRFVLKAAGVRGGELRARTSGVLRRVGLGGLEGAYPPRLSGGEQQRLAIARALAVPKPILLLDEPLAHVNAELKAAILELLMTIKAGAKTTMIYVTHQREEDAGLGDRFFRLEEGSLTG